MVNFIKKIDIKRNIFLEYTYGSELPNRDILMSKKAKFQSCLDNGRYLAAILLCSHHHTICNFASITLHNCSLCDNYVEGFSETWDKLGTNACLYVKLFSCVHFAVSFWDSWSYSSN